MNASAVTPRSGLRGRLARIRHAARPRQLDWTLRDARQLVQLLDVIPGNRAKLRTIAMWSSLSRRPGRPKTVRWRVAEGSFTAVVADVSELKILHEVFVAGEYEQVRSLSPDLVVDLGSNVGISVLYFRALFPRARIVAVEPEPSAYERLTQNIAHLDGVTTVQAAMGDRDGEVTLYSGAESWAASTTPSTRTPNAASVPARTLDSLVEELTLERIGLLKMDIEGAETAVLRDEAARRAEAIVLEFHQEHTDRTVWDVLGELEDHELVHLHGDSASHPVLTLRRWPADGTAPAPGA